MSFLYLYISSVSHKAGELNRNEKRFEVTWLSLQNHRFHHQYFPSLDFNHYSNTHSQSTQVPLINKLLDNKMTGCLINNQRIAAWESGAVHDLDVMLINPQPTSSQRRTTHETPRRERLFKAASADVNQNSLIWGAKWKRQSSREAWKWGMRQLEKSEKVKTGRGAVMKQWDKEEGWTEKERQKELYSLINRCLNLN